MKIPHSNGKLARKRSILEAAVLEVEAEADFTRFHQILDMKKINVVEAVDRLQTTTLDSDDRFAVPGRKKREGGIPHEVKLSVTTWWTEETRVSPNRKDIWRKHLGRNLYDTHLAHLLLETQVPYSILVVGGCMNRS